MAGPVRIAILANAFQAIREMRRTARESERMGRALERVREVGRNVRNSMGQLASGLLKVVGIAAQLAATFSTLAPVLLKAGGAVVNVAKAAGNAAPALAAFAAAAVFIKLTLTAIGPAVGKALSPVTEGFKKAGTEAGKLASKGVKPLAAAFAKLGMPVISADMNTIAKATNGVVKGFLNWAKSGPGLNALSHTTLATATAFKNVAPHVQRLAIALASMIGRIAGVSLKAGSAGLSGILDKLSTKLDKITAASVQKGFDDLKQAFLSIKSAVVAVGGAVQKVIDFYKKFETQIRAVADVFAVLAIVMAVAFGGPVGIAIFAAIGLMIRHFDEVKAAVQKVKDAFKSDGATSFMDGLKQVADQVFPALKKAFEDIRTAVLPTLKEILASVKNDLIPAFGGFLVAMAPVVAFFITTLVPIITNAMTTILGVIKGAIQIITGIFTVFTGILHGDWSQVWEGIKQILSGAVTILKALVTGLWNGIKAAFDAGKAIVIGIWKGQWELVKAAIGIAASAIAGKLTQIKSAISSKFSEMKSAVSAKMREIVTAVRDKIQAVRSAITSIDLGAAGRALIQGLINGITSKLGALRDVASQAANTIKGLFPGSPIKRGPLKSWNGGGAGKRLVDLLITGISSRTKALSVATHATASTIGTGIVGSPKDGTNEFGWSKGLTVNVNFTGVVGDPVEVGRQIDRVVTKYYNANGRRAKQHDFTTNV